jgi:catechol 2,3-dioxygenase-like lactoylglutathione lyase family enzyme
MTVELNHTIVWSNDARKSAAFLAEMLSLPEPRQQFHFMVVELGNGVSMDFADQEGPIASQHYAFLVDEARFDAGLALIRERGLPHWADPARRQAGEINHRLGGRGVYFADPDGHFLEILTLPESREQPA